MVRDVLARVLRLDDMREKQESTRIIHIDPIGTAGTQSYAGYPSEEYLQALQGRQRADVLDQMRRSDPQVIMMLKAVKYPILAAEWTIQPVDENDEEEKFIAEFVDHVLFKGTDKPKKRLLREILTFLDFGFSAFEIVDKVVLNHPKFGSYNGIASIALRSARTIERWNLDGKTDKLTSITQYSYGDLQRTVDIPAEFLVVFSLDREGANYEGISALRPCYGNWFRKNKYLKFNAIGIEKFAIPTPLVEIPDGKQNTEEFTYLVAALKKYLCHQENYLTVPAGWKVTLSTNTYDPELVEKSIDSEDRRMAKAFLQNFLELGMNGVGSNAQSTNLSDFFVMSLDYIAEIVCEEINMSLIPRIVQMKFGPRESYPTLNVSGVGERFTEAFSVALKNLADSKIIQPDDRLEAEIRKRARLPAASEEGRRTVQPQTPQFQAPTLMDRIRSMRLTRGSQD